MFHALIVRPTRLSSHPKFAPCRTSRGRKGSISTSKAREAGVPAYTPDGWLVPTIVLVHGAFADASGWADVFRLLTDRGYPVYARANPLRGVAGNGEYLRAFVATLDGPVVLVGHSYGGSVITNGSAGSAAVKALALRPRVTPTAPILDLVAFRRL